MATQLQMRRGTQSEHTSFTGAEGEVSVNTTNESLHVHNGSAAGGFELARADLDNVSDSDLNAALTGNTIGSLTITTADITNFSLGGVSVTSTAAELNILDGVTATATEINLLDGVTATTAELNYVDGVTSAIQTQIDTKAPLASPTFTGTVTAAALTVDTDTLHVDATNNRVGVGTGSPATKAHIYDASTDAVLYIDSANSNGSHARFLASGSVKHFVGSGGGFGLGDVDDFAIRSFDNLIFATNNSSTERMRLDASGNLLVGTTTINGVGGSSSPEGVVLDGNNAQLTIGTSSDVSATFNRQTTDGNIVQFRKDGSIVGSIGTEGGDLTIGNADTGLQFVNTSQIIRPQNLTTNAAIDAQVDLGQSAYRFKDLYLSGGARLGPMLGSPLSYVNGTSFTYNSDRGFITSHTTTSASAGVENGLLLINNDSTVGRMSPIINFSARSASGSYNHSYAQMYGLKTGSGSDSNWNSGALVFATTSSTGPSERMRLDSSGRLMVNQTAASAAGAGVKMQVATDLLTTGAYAGYFWENRSGMTITSTSGWGGWYSTGTASHFLFSDDANRASIGRTSGTYTALSDVNKKKDFEDSTVGLAAIMQLQPKKFRMLDDADDAPKYLGFVAQDVENVIPEAYVEDTSVDAGGVENTFIGLTDRPFIAALVKAIQEQQATIAALEARITQLENN